MSNILQFPTAPRPVIDDTPARAQALDTRISCIVEAPAGSGKTGLLVQRYLKLLGDPGVETPEEILAITFTRKATAELQERVLKELHAAHTATPLAADASPFHTDTRAFATTALARGWDLLNQPHRLNIRSIDSVCASIANALPLLSGSGGPHQPLDDASGLYRQAARRTLLQLGGPNRGLHNALHDLLLHRDGNIADCEALLAEMLGTREQWGELVPLGTNELDEETLDREVRPKLEATLEAIICAGLSRALALMPAHLLDELTTLAAEIGMAPAWKDRPPALSICANKHLSPAAKADELDHWHALIHLVLTGGGTWRRSIDRGSIGHDFDLKLHKPRIAGLVETIATHPLGEQLQQALCDVRELPPATYPDDQWRIARALFRILSHALIELKLLFAERGECDFAELSLNARLALQREFESSPATDISAAGAALTSGSRLRHLLVDEMQDTSSAQYTLLELLTRSWDGHSQTLILVGDPKQSIYLFRQARVERFLRVMREAHLGDIPLTPLRLTANFRSQATLVHRFNDTFERIFPSPDAAAPGDVPYLPADAKRDPAPGPALHWHTTVLSEPTSTPNLPRSSEEKFNAQQQEARDVCRIIANYLSTTLEVPSHNFDFPFRSEAEEPAFAPQPSGALSGVPNERSLLVGVASVPLHGTGGMHDVGTPKPKRIAILVRNRSHLGEIVAELKRSNLPYRALDIDSLGERPEVLDTLALTRALLHPADRAAWLAVLHAPWCGLGLGDLLTLTGDGNSPTTPPTPPSTTPGVPSSPTAPSSAKVGPLQPPPLTNPGAPSSPTASSSAKVGPQPPPPLTTPGAPSSPTASSSAKVGPQQPSDPNATLASLIRTRSSLLTTSAQHLLARAWPILETSLATLGRTSLALHVERTWLSLGGDAWLTPEQRANVLRYFDLLHKTETEGDGRINLDLLTARLGKLYAEAQAGEPAIELLTIHNSKGLEWDLVLVPGLHRPPRHSSDVLLDWLEFDEQSDATLLLAPIQARGNNADPLNEWLRRTRAHRERAEEKRLVYVAATRARQELHLFATARRKQDGPLALPTSGTLLRALWPVAEAHFPAPAQTSSHIILPDDEPFASEDEAYTPLALAASAASAFAPTVQRLPATFDPALRFTQSPRLPYPAAATLRRAATFERPEGGFAARAFGNVVHRYLQLLADRLATGVTPSTLLPDLPSWLPRLTASLRGEGLAPTAARREAERALDALNRTLTDPTGLWILSPHTAATSEQALSTPLGSLRADRTFLSDPAPPSTGDGHIWIVDFKTTEQGSRTDEAFESSERQTYSAQLEAYATLRRTLPDGHRPIHLALYYPLIPKLITWLA